MDRKLLTFFVGLAVTITLRAIPITAQPKDAHRSAAPKSESPRQEQGGKPNGDPNQPKALASPANPQITASAPPKTDPPRREPYDWNEWGKPSVLTNLALVGVAIWAGCIALGTLKAIRAEVKATAKAAKAATDNATAAINHPYWAGRADGWPEGLRYAIAAALVCCGVVPAAAQTSDACDALAALKLLDVTITAAAPVEAGAFRAPGAAAAAPGMNTPAFCRVAATLHYYEGLQQEIGRRAGDLGVRAPVHGSGDGPLRRRQRADPLRCARRARAVGREGRRAGDDGRGADRPGRDQAHAAALRLPAGREVERHRQSRRGGNFTCRQP